MTETAGLKVSDKVRQSFAPIMSLLDQVRHDLRTVPNVVRVRPGFAYPPTGKPLPAMVVAVTPGTSPVSASELVAKFGVPFNVLDATIEEQEAATREPSVVSFSEPETAALSVF